MAKLKSDELIAAAAASLERRRQEVVDAAWRPLKCNVPWTEQEAAAYRALNPRLEDDRRREYEWNEARVENSLCAAELNVVPFRK